MSDERFHEIKDWIEHITELGGDGRLLMYLREAVLELERLRAIQAQ